MNTIGCVLYNHNRDKVIGKILSAKIEDNRGIAEIEFDEDAESDVVYQKVASGTLKGVSVGYMVEGRRDPDVFGGKTRKKSTISLRITAVVVLPL